MSHKLPEEQIRELLLRYKRGECTEQEIALLHRWYERISGEKDAVRLLSPAEEERLVLALWTAIDAKEKVAREETAVSNSGSDEAGEEARGDEEPADEKPTNGFAVNEWDTRRRQRRLLFVAAVWAGVIVVSGGIWMQWSRRAAKSNLSRTADFTVLSTGYQQVRKVLLPDSSIVWLNSATHLYYPPNFVTNREVRLSGEAFFEVAPDAAHPFVVKAGNASTRVVGTAFNVSAYPEAGQLRISLKSGKVGVEYDGKGGKAGKVLTPGQLLIYDKESGSGRVMQQSPGEMDEWKEGRLLFYETPLKEALAQVEARYGIHIIYDKPLKDQTITARFENTALEKVLEYLSFGWDLHFSRTKDSLHVWQGAAAGKPAPQGTPAPDHSPATESGR